MLLAWGALEWFTLCLRFIWYDLAVWTSYRYVYLIAGVADFRLDWFSVLFCLFGLCMVFLWFYAFVVVVVGVFGALE